MVNVKPQTDEEKREERNRKRRERYAKQKQENGQSVRPRKVNGTKAKSNKNDNTQISMILGTVSGIVASRPNMAHWQLTPQEIESLATPISNMLSESEMFQGLSEHSDAIALVTACFTVFVPRIMITIATTPKKEKKNGRNITSVSNDRPKPKQTGKNNDTVSEVNKQSTTNGSNVNHTEHWVGSALA